MLKQIALYGGSFDPPHLSHLRLIQNLLSMPGIDEVWLLPCGDRTDKHLIMSKQKRFGLMRRLYHSEPKITVSQQQIELNRRIGKMVHTYDLMRVLRDKYKDHNFHLVYGGDIVETFHEWGNYKQLLEQNSFIFCERKGYTIPTDKLPPRHRIISDQGLHQISSSYIKGVLTDKEKSVEEKMELVGQWLHQEVLDYLKEEGVL